MIKLFGRYIEITKITKFHVVHPIDPHASPREIKKMLKELKGACPKWVYARAINTLSIGELMNNYTFSKNSADLAAKVYNLVK